MENEIKIPHDFLKYAKMFAYFRDDIFDGIIPVAWFNKRNFNVETVNDNLSHRILTDTLKIQISIPLAKSQSIETLYFSIATLYANVLVCKQTIFKYPYSLFESDKIAIESCIENGINLYPIVKDFSKLCFDSEAKKINHLQLKRLTQIMQKLVSLNEFC